MADTTAYLDAERWIRQKGLPARFPGHSFASKGLQVGTKRDGSPRSFEFDAVSTDGTIVALVKGSSGLTAGGKLPVAKTKDAYADLLFLSLVQAERRLLILTDPEFHGIFDRVSDGRVPPGVEVVHIPLPSEIQASVDTARRAATREVSPK